MTVKARKRHAVSRPLIGVSVSGAGQSSKIMQKKRMICMHLQKMRSFSYLGMMVWRCVCGWWVMRAYAVSFVCISMSSLSMPSR